MLTRDKKIIALPNEKYKILLRTAYLLNIKKLYRFVLHSEVTVLDKYVGWVGSWS